MGMGVSDALRAVIRAAVGLPADPGTPPDLMRLGLYPAQVQAVASDGSTLDVQPADKRIAGEKNVTLRVGVPGSVAVVQPGAVVLLGWEGGDPKKPYCVPHWDQGATVVKLVLKATTVYLGDESGAEALVKKSEFNDHTHTVPGTGTTCVNGSAWTGTATSAKPAAITGTTNVQGK